MKDNGGLLDEVIFTVNTEEESDLAYLDELVATHPGYTKYEPKEEYGGWKKNWEGAQDKDAIYIKIDDDVVRAVPPAV